MRRDGHTSGEIAARLLRNLYSTVQVAETEDVWN